jgi:hypothetical protein
MDKELVNIVLKKSFIELTDIERNEILEWCSSEEEFDQMKQVFIEVELMKKSQNVNVNEEKKRDLDILFHDKFKARPAFWSNSVVVALYPIDKPFQRRPLIQAAALALLFFISYPLYQNVQNDIEDTRFAKNEEVKKQTIKQEEPVKDPLVKNEAIVENKQHTTPADFVFESEKPNESVSDDDFNNEGVEVLSMPLASSVAKSEEMSVRPSFNHSDGVFETNDMDAKFSKPVSETPDYLDLLTAAF